MMVVTFVKTADGYAGFKGDPELGMKLCTVTTKTDTGMTQNGRLVLGDMPRESWVIHFCYPMLHVGEIEAVMTALPTAA